MIDAFAIAVFDALVLIARRVAPRFGDAAEHLREVARPPRGVELRADDGSLYTGFVVVERSRPVVMLAVRVGDRPSIVTPPPLERPAYERQTHFGGQRPLHVDPDDPRWDYENPYARR